MKRCLCIALCFMLILLILQPSYAEEYYVIPNLDQPATNTKKVSTITDPRKRVSSL